MWIGPAAHPFRSGSGGACVGISRSEFSRKRAGRQPGSPDRPGRHGKRNAVYQDMLNISKLSAPDTRCLSQRGVSWIDFLHFTGRTA
jgi:hypothetical protein